MRFGLVCGSLIAALIASLGLGSSARATTLEIATLAPKRSAWGSVFSAWSRAVDKKTGGKLVLKFYWSASQGDESTVVAKLRSGQLDGGTLGARGLAEIHKPVLALQLPGLFRTWKGIDRANAAVFEGFRSAFDKQGFYLSSLGDVGRARTMAKGWAVRTPEDLKRMKTMAPRGGIIAPVMASVMGVTPVRIGIPEILPALTSGRVNLLTVPPLAAEQLQWAPYFDHIHEDVVGIGIGAMVLSKKSLERVDADQLETMRRTGKKAGALLRKRVRRLDDEAYTRLAQRMTVVKLSGAEKARWATLFGKVRARLSDTEFPVELVRKLESVADR
jgi:TRAP-type C4-dicarboxylate transport system substrate-binding protein